MAKAGSEYQLKVAQFFQAIGLTAKVEEKVAGVRAEHSVDVFVTGQLGPGFPIKWVVECKDWATNIPKEKALALISIVQDVGADRGWLLSETGFQTGAVHAAHSTNVTLTSLEYLKESTDDYFSKAAISSLLSQVVILNDKITNLWHEYEKKHGDYSFMTTKRECTRAGTDLMSAQIAIKMALRNDYPIYPSETDPRIAHNEKDLILLLGESLKKNEEIYLRHRKEFDEE